MILDGASVASVLEAEVAVVGAGPAGIVTALELAGAGIDVVLLESGGEHFAAETQELGDAAHWDPALHAPMAMTTRRQIGGASEIWGGRCVPFDPVDFDARPWLTTHRWPVSYDDLEPYFQRACDWFVCGRAVFDAMETGSLPPSVVPGLPNLDVRTSTLERWSLPTRFGERYGERLRDAARLRLVTGVTCTRVVVSADGRGIERLAGRTLAGREIDVRARRYVLACGGLETTRLLLASPDANGRPVGDHSGHLGRWYMGHVEGVIANVRLTTPPRETIYDYERDVDGVYVRRRLSLSPELQHREGLPNTIAWLAHPDLADASHRSGVLSFAYLALASPLGGRMAPEALRVAMTGERVPGAPYGGGERSPKTAHLRNVVRDAVATGRFAATFGVRRFVARGRRVPGFAVYNRDNVYPLHYHGEHVPQRESRVTLSDRLDAVGMPRLEIALRFCDDDVDGAVRVHRHWDEFLRRHGAGSLEYLVPDPAEGVRGWLGGGFHQSGTTRMSARSEDGVVDPDLAVHGFPSLHVVSSSVFPTSSQANSTFMIVPFALRLVERIRRER